MGTAVEQAPDRLRLSVIVPATDRPATLERCVDAIRRAAAPPDEIIVVDSPPRSGPAAARNAGAARATGSVLVFVDSDVLVHRDAFERIRTALATDPERVAVFGSYDDAPAANGVVSIFRNLLHHWIHHSSAGRATTFWAGLGAVRSDAFRAVGGFDARRFPVPSVEDIELGLRLARTGTIELDPRIQGTHLKRWGLRSMVVTDLIHRARPWVALMLARGRSSVRLERERAPSGGHRRVPRGAGARGDRPPAAAALLGVLFVGINARLYGLLLRRGGVRAVAAGFVLHVLHSVIALLAAPAGLLLFARDRHAVAPRIARLRPASAAAASRRRPAPAPPRPARASAARRGAYPVSRRAALDSRRAEQPLDGVRRARGRPVRRAEARRRARARTGHPGRAWPPRARRAPSPRARSRPNGSDSEVMRNTSSRSSHGATSCLLAGELNRVAQPGAVAAGDQLRSLGAVAHHDPAARNAAPVKLGQRCPRTGPRASAARGAPPPRPCRPARARSASAGARGTRQRVRHHDDARGIDSVALDGARPRPAPAPRSAPWWPAAAGRGGRTSGPAEGRAANARCRSAWRPAAPRVRSRGPRANGCGGAPRPAACGEASRPGGRSRAGPGPGAAPSRLASPAATSRSPIGPRPSRKQTRWARPLASRRLPGRAVERKRSIPPIRPDQVTWSTVPGSARGGRDRARAPSHSSAKPTLLATCQTPSSSEHDAALARRPAERLAHQRPVEGRLEPHARAPARLRGVVAERSPPVGHVLAPEPPQRERARVIHHRGGLVSQPAPVEHPARAQLAILRRPEALVEPADLVEAAAREGEVVRREEARVVVVGVVLRVADADHQLARARVGVSGQRVHGPAPEAVLRAAPRAARPAGAASRGAAGNRRR